MLVLLSTSGESFVVCHCRRTGCHAYHFHSRPPFLVAAALALLVFGVHLSNSPTPIGGCAYCLLSAAFYLANTYTSADPTSSFSLRSRRAQAMCAVILCTGVSLELSRRMDGRMGRPSSLDGALALPATAVLTLLHVGERSKTIILSCQSDILGHCHPRAQFDVRLSGWNGTSVPCSARVERTSDAVAAHMGNGSHVLYNLIFNVPATHPANSTLSISLPTIAANAIRIPISPTAPPRFSLAYRKDPATLVMRVDRAALSLPLSTDMVDARVTSPVRRGWWQLWLLADASPTPTRVGVRDVVETSRGCYHVLLDAAEGSFKPGDRLHVDLKTAASTGGVEIPATWASKTTWATTMNPGE